MDVLARGNPQRLKPQLKDGLRHGQSRARSEHFTESSAI
jgi:hypothetical protein